jgi:hypothetical protein
MKTPPRPYDIKNFESRRLRFELVLTVLACVVPTGAQKTTSSTDLTSMLHSTRASSGFGAVDAGTSGAVDVSVQSYTGVMGLDASSGYTGGMASSGHTGKAPTSRDKFLAKSSAASMMPREIQRTRSSGFSERAQREIAHPVRFSVTMQGLGKGSAVSLPLQSGPPSDILQKDRSFEDSTGTESGISAGDTGAPPVGFERIGESFETSHGASFEAPCGQSCGLSPSFGTVEGRHTAAKLEKALSGRLSRSTDRLDVSNMVEGSSGKLFGQLATSESRLRKGTSRPSNVSVFGGSNTQP